MSSVPLSEEPALNEQQQQEIVSANDQIKLMRSMMGVPPGMLAVSEARLPFAPGPEAEGAHASLGAFAGCCVHGCRLRLGRGEDPNPEHRAPRLLATVAGAATAIAGGRTKAGGSKAAGTPKTAVGATSLARIAAKARARDGARAMARSRPRSSRNASYGSYA